MIEEKKNNLNYIRLFAGIGVVMLHLINQGGILNNILDRKVAYPIITLIYGLFFTCINLFGFLSGYLLYKKEKINKKRIIGILGTTIFYSFIITIIFFAFNLYDVKNTPFNIVDLKNYIINGYININTMPNLLISSLFPMLYNEYWYVTCYLVLYLCTPYLNTFIKNVDRKKYKKLLVLLFILFTIPQFLINYDFFKINNGYSVFWLIYCYLIGAYISKYQKENDYKSTKLIFVGIISLIIATILNIITNKYRLNNMGIDWLYLRFLDYISPFNVLLSLCIFLLFLKIDIKNNNILNRIVSFLAKASFAVYIIHVHPLIFYKYIKGLLSFSLKYNTLNIILITFGTACTIYLICAIIEWLKGVLIKITKGVF